VIRLTVTRGEKEDAEGEDDVEDEDNETRRDENC